LNISITSLNIIVANNSTNGQQKLSLYHITLFDWQPVQFDECRLIKLHWLSVKQRVLYKQALNNF